MRKILSEGLCFTGLLATVAFLNTAGRFAIPKLLNYQTLASYSIFWTVICGPFIILQAMMGFVLLPKIREHYIAGQLFQKMQETKKTFPAALILITLFGIFMYFFSSWVIGIAYPHKYFIPDSVKVLLVFLGLLRFCYAFVSALVGAVASVRELLIANILAIISVIIFFLLAFLLYRNMGLFGIVLSLCCAWIFRSTGWAVMGVVSLKRHHSER